MYRATATAEVVAGVGWRVQASGSGCRSRLADLVDRASARAVRADVDRIVEMPMPLGELLRGRGLRRGSTVTVRGSTAMLFAMLVAATRAGCWCAVVGMPDLGLLAADELGVDLERLETARTRRLPVGEGGRRRRRG